MVRNFVFVVNVFLGFKRAAYQRFHHYPVKVFSFTPYRDSNIPVSAATSLGLKGRMVGPGVVFGKAVMRAELS